MDFAAGVYPSEALYPAQGKGEGGRVVPERRLEGQRGQQFT